MTKVTIIGAGNVGATCANVLAFNKIVSTIVLVDIREGIAEGKAIDILQTAQTLGFETNIIGVTNDYEATCGSDVVVVTSGIPRKPGMTREELIGTNAVIVKDVVTRCLVHSPNTIFVIISNPMDTMTYLTLKCTGLKKNRIIGMGGILDSSRFKYFLKIALKANPSQIDGMVIGGHGDTTMIPLKRLATYNGIPVNKLLPSIILDKVVIDTMNGGATLTKLLGTSAWYAPGASAAYLVESIIKNYKRIIPSCVYLDGEYKQKDICIGVPSIIGRYGVESIIDIKLNVDETELFNNSSETVRNTNNILKNINVF
ncbi:MAG: malate dehydrogenase [Bacteroidales bacterium OttesenSCG-928-I14]|jgi:malate dehydrogenase|nr:malate dehydrogenase [Bacteroidales bacterium OttesenSCG-928-I14]